ncbi:secreted protein [Mycobacterium phage Theia]|uniref:Lipoprotein n=1 Tax=Mycobacterium phage Theia TaxID=1718172 RepID=A0A0N9SJG9_9CAUD|nr:secreted protein [Mycobacterium phage Theia]ALH46894.1 hypothetical protein SEA_THEIA_42 [Mycobacterium phage Theia]AXC33318.1 hypothetical protein SEA_DUBLIN_43 [Mycobacterium phage Dublin]QGJ92218.1 hypothetical protein SEA_MARYSWELL_43 [Mycobacterium phage MarysWell]
MKRLAALVAAVGLSFGLSSCAYMNHQTKTCLVEEKDRTTKVVDGNSRSEMRIYTDCGVFVVEDNLLAGFNSADVYGRLKPGKTYEITTGGYRIGFLSEFPKIIDVKEVE